MQPRTDRQRELLARLDPLLPVFAERAAAHDRDASFPHDNIAALRETGYFASPIPSQAGGGGFGLEDVIVAQAAIAGADGATAYSVGMHLMSVGTELANPGWPAPLRQRIFRDIVQRGALINAIATEPELGSPQGGGRPGTTARPEGPGRWRIDGHKTFSTLAPALDWFLTYVAFEDGSNERGRVAVPRDAPGLRIEETWDALGLRASGSHDVYFDGVIVTTAEILGRHGGDRGGQAGADFAWFALLVSASAFGIAQAARDYAVDFARRRQPTGYAEPIGALPTVRQAIGRMDAELMAAEALLRATAAAWDAEPEGRAALGPRVAGAKLTATDAAVRVVDRAMRLVGGVSLQRSEPLERYYRDVRGPLHNPPIEPRALEMIARAALEG